jgi:diacylglycerol kinase family enzyme
MQLGRAADAAAEPGRSMPRRSWTRVYVNPAAGLRNRRHLAGVAEALAAEDVASEIVEVPPAELGAALTNELRSGTPTVAVAGGDGTLRAAASALIGSDCTLAPFPTGTLNNFCRRMDLPTVQATARALAYGGVRPVNVGQAGGALFLNTCLCGAYASVVRRRERLRGLLAKWPAAAVATLEAVARLRLIDVVAEVGPDVFSRTTPLLWVGMGRGSFPRSSRSESKEQVPELEVVVFRARSRVGAAVLLVRYLPRMFPLGPIRSGSSFEVLHTPGLRVATEGELDVTLDGEPVRMRGPFRIAVAPERLRVVAPPGP